MSMKYGFLSFLAFCICLFTLLKNYEVWTHPLGEVSENMAERKSAEKPKAPPAIQVQKNPNFIRSPILIAEKNIFSPERKDFSGQAGAKFVSRPQIILYGITLAGDYQSASLVNPGRSLRKGERETITLRLGEQISGYKLARVSSDRIQMERAGDSFEVLLYDSKSPKRRNEPKTENRLAMAANPAAAESNESRADIPPKVASQATPGKPQGSVNEGGGPKTSIPGLSASMSSAAPVTPSTKVTPTQAIQVLRERARRGRAMAPMAPIAPVESNPAN